MSLIEIYQKINQRVFQICSDCGRDPSTVKILAVTKKQSPEIINHYLNLKLDEYLLGENYVKEFSDKKDSLLGRYQAHFIGHLQSNKVKDAVNLFDVIQTVDSFKLINKIGASAKLINKKQKIFLQVNISNDQNKSGIAVEQLAELVGNVLLNDNLELLGLMTITKDYQDHKLAYYDYLKLSELAKKTEKEFNIQQLLLSMGMSQDFEYAIKAGSNLIRIGTALFGERLR